MIFNIIAVVLVLNFVASLIFFIKDGFDAKKNNRARNAGIIAWLITSIIIIVSVVLVIVGLYLLVEAFMASM